MSLSHGLTMVIKQSRFRRLYRGSSVRQKSKNSSAGYTLLELLVSMTLSLVILSAVYAVYKVQARTLGVQQNRQEAQDYARGVLDLMVREIRNAGYNPLQVSSGTNCAGSPTSGTPGIVTANSTTVKLTLDSRG